MNWPRAFLFYGIVFSVATSFVILGNGVLLEQTVLLLTHLC